jgi:HEAT repeat protein
MTPPAAAASLVLLAAAEIPMNALHSIVPALAAVSLLATDVAAAHPESESRRACEKLLESFDPLSVSRRHPGTIVDLLSIDPAKREAALAMLAATQSADAIPWILPFLDAQEERVRVHAGLALSRIVEAEALKRRDPAFPDRVVLRPLREEDRDLRALAWIVARMLEKPDDGSTHAYACAMIRYLELCGFEGRLQGLLESRHPAVREKAKWALEELRRFDPAPPRTRRFVGTAPHQVTIDPDGAKLEPQLA